MSQKKILSDDALNQLFREARTYNNWQKKEVSDVTLQALYDLMKMGPTSANCSPLRIVFVKTDAARARLKPTLAPGNVDKTMSAPVTAILAQDMKFYDHMPKLFPHTDAKAWFVGNDQLIKDTAFRNASLQAAYFIMAARSLGLDCGPMSGFDTAAVDKEFLNGTSFTANMLCNLGYGDEAGMYPRSPRFAFDEICSIL